MSDEAEFWKGLRQVGQTKRANNREASRTLLEEAGVQFEVRNEGAHLVVHAKGAVFDFWPGTGLWIERPAARRGRGVHALIQLVT